MFKSTCWTGESVLVEKDIFFSLDLWPLLLTQFSCSLKWFDAIMILISVFTLDSFWTNPQFRLKLHGDFSENTSDKNIYVSVMQKPDKRRRQKCRKFHIGFSVFEVSLTPDGSTSLKCNIKNTEFTLVLHQLLTGVDLDTSRLNSGPCS